MLFYDCIGERTFRKYKLRKESAMKDKARIIEDKEIIELFLNRDESAIKHSEEKYGRYLSAVAYNILIEKEKAYLGSGR